MSVAQQKEEEERREQVRMQRIRSLTDEELAQAWRNTRDI
jgi:hypothetical protein